MDAITDHELSKTAEDWYNNIEYVNTGLKTAFAAGYGFAENHSKVLKQQQVITGNELYKELENWFEERHGIATIGEYTEMQEISFGGRFEEIREFLNHIGLNCEEA